ncbi:hypothetical protein [Cryobacterium sp. AP23]
MSLTQDAEADQRWAAAQKIAAGGIDERMPRRRRIVLLWISVFFVGSLLLGVVLTAVLPPLDTSEAEVEGWSPRVIAGYLFQGAGVLIGVVGFVWAIRTDRYITRWRAVASPLRARERKWVQKQIRTGAPIDDEQKMSVVLAIAAQNRSATLGVLPIFACSTLIAVGVGLSSPWDLIAWVELVVVLAFIVLFALLARDYRRAGVYLDTFGGDRD